ncbi:MAG: helix-turn-helix domain-containing protein [Chloroflexi bacterium]|uniref:Helix-turn-helix domain-containing protein n=1 Tax=Candidatus Chlorohelix allophototropha TaxID=3003348 RepID=A0A8T7M6B5_9CHLR|nr:helix-turn-helix domain-containing protein [Chloroflexota bacterium]WJW69546.1 hypothetical protein OZ401_003165 [Chloroflexota bacterium L227-S17]
MQKQALKLYLEGTSFRVIGRLLNVHHQSVINWINAQATNLPPQVSETQATHTIEIDELFTFPTLISKVSCVLLFRHSQ